MGKYDEEVAKYDDWDYNIKVAGVKFKQPELAQLQPLDWENLETILVRDPNNEFDSNAIAVQVNGIQVGWIPATIAKVLAPQMDDNARFDAKVIYITSAEGKKIHTIKLALNRKE